MFITSRRVGFIFLGLLLLAGNSWAQGTSTFEGIVRNPKGQPVKGAEVRVETKGPRIISKAMTDARGHYVTKPVPAGVYKVELVIDSVTKASLPSAKTNSSGATELNFDIKAGAKKRVFVKETGSQFGHWVDEDEANAAGNSNLTKAKAETARRWQDKSGSGQAAGPGGN